MWKYSLILTLSLFFKEFATAVYEITNLSYQRCFEGGKNQMFTQQGSQKYFKN